MEWTERTGPELTAAQLHAILELRGRVFVVEQECAYGDIDGLDLAPTTHHLWADSGGRVAAYARLLAPGPEAPARIGRVVVDPADRGTGLGHDVLGRSVAACDARWPGVDVVLAAQAHLTGYYAAAGFVPIGEAYLDDGIPHVDMVLARA